MATDPRFRDDEARAANGNIISERMNKWSANYTSAEALVLLAEAKIPAGEVLKPAPGVTGPAYSDHVCGAGISDCEKACKLVGPSALLSDTPPEFYLRAPMAGEHTDEILAGIGYSQGEIAELREKNIV